MNGQDELVGFGILVALWLVAGLSLLNFYRLGRIKTLLRAVLAQGAVMSAQLDALTEKVEKTTTVEESAADELAAAVTANTPAE